jgi:flagellar hook protein FlgE
MGLSSAMNSGVSGLQIFGNAMSVIGNNLSNSNTTGYKASRTLFSELLPETTSASAGTAQIGRGANVSTVEKVFNQGSIEASESGTDLAIEGSGFFIVSDPESGANFYTRDGSFKLDHEGTFINTEGYKVQGYPLDEDGNIMGVVQDINVETNAMSPAKMSSEASIDTNLSSNAEEKTWDLDDPAGTSNFSTSMEVYDSQGSTHLLTMFFNKTSSANNEWEYHFTVSSDEVDNAAGNPTDTAGDIVEIASGALDFDESGQLEEIVDPDGNPIPAGNPDFPKITIAGTDMDWNNGSTSGDIEFELDFTQFATSSEVVSEDVNGYAAGNLNNIAINSDGVVTAIFSNGYKEPISQLALANFSDNSGLIQVSDGLYESSEKSGTPLVGTVGSGVGTIYSNALEGSTVDIAGEFSNMILVQRAFQANSKTITTTDEMLNEVINMKR